MDDLLFDRVIPAGLAAVGLAFGAFLYFILVEQAVIPSIVPCENSRAIEVAQSLEDEGAWVVNSETHITRKSDNLSIWWGNSVYGLGIDPTGYAMPGEGGTIPTMPFANLPDALPTRDPGDTFLSPLRETNMTPSQIAILASELEGCQSVAGEVYVPTTLANRIVAALREFEQDKREWVTVERMDR